MIGIHAGRLIMTWPNELACVQQESAGLVYADNRMPLQWKWERVEGPSQSGVLVPLWIPAIVGAITACIGFISVARRMRRHGRP